MKKLMLGAPLLLAAACGGSDGDADSGGAAATGQVTASVTFHEHVEPILQKRCQTCHHEGGIGPFSLLSYDDAFRQASALVKQASTRAMPPWGQATTDECKPRHGFRGDPTLTTAEIDTLSKWLAEGAVEGDPKKAPAPRTFGDELLTGTTEDWKIPNPYLVKAGLSDEFMCFVIDPKLTETIYLDGVAFVPGNPKVSHHALAFVDPTGEAAKLADAEGKYQCFGGPRAAGSLMTAWAPGVPPADFGSRIGLEVPAGAVIRRSFVIASDSGRSRCRSNWRSRLVMIPTSVPLASTTGTPLMRNRAMRATVSRRVAVGCSVIGLRIMPLSERFTRSTSAACRSIDMFLWSTPMPPARAIAMAISDSVTVSIAAETIGNRIRRSRVRRVSRVTSLGRTVECAGTRETSS